MPSDRTIEGILAYAKQLKGMDVSVLREGFEVMRLHRRVEQVIENDLSGWGLTIRQVEIMEALYHNAAGTLTPADLSDEVGLTRSAMTSALDSLEKQGYTVRNPHPTDRRMVAISLTESGRGMMEKHLPERYRRVHHITANCLSKEERDCIVRGFERVLEFLGQDVAKEPT